ncbi:MAG: hypothetical protein HY301_00975 [Verrucomicrobia bacterium]|nr:hypothetical protein [Verrucomicrobiota bacterium]
MRKRICFIPVLIVAALTAIFGIDAGRAGERAKSKRPNLEKTHGDVRVVLLRIGQVVTSTNKPKFVVTYVVEIPKEGAFSDLHFRSDKELRLFVRGKPLEPHGEVSSGAMGFEKLPRRDELTKPTLHEGKAMIAQNIELTEFNVREKKLDVKIEFTWRGKEMSFDFKDVPMD